MYGSMRNNNEDTCLNAIFWPQNYRINLITKELIKKK